MVFAYPHGLLQYFFAMVLDFSLQAENNNGARDVE